MHLYLVIPAYNEEKRISPTLIEYCNFFRKKNIKLSILVVLNGCIDNTEQIVSNLQKKYSEINYITFFKRGKGASIIYGFNYFLNKYLAKKILIKNYKNKFLGFVDADNSIKPVEYLKLINELEKKPIDGVIASRRLKNSITKGKSSYKKLQSSIFNFLVNFLFNLKFLDTQCGAKVFTIKATNDIIKVVTISNYAFDIDLLFALKKTNNKILEIPIIWEEKKGSTIQNSFKTAFIMFLSLIRLRILYSPFKGIYNFFEPFFSKISKI